MNIFNKLTIELNFEDGLSEEDVVFLRSEIMEVVEEHMNGFGMQVSRRVTVMEPNDDDEGDDEFDEGR